MTEETNVIDAQQWRWLRRLAASRPDHAIARRSAAAAARPARGAGDLAEVAGRLLVEWHAAGTAAIAADLRILNVALRALRDQPPAEDREQGGGTAWTAEASAAAAYSLAARDVADLPPDRGPAARLTAMVSGLWESHRWLAAGECTGSEAPRR